MSTKKGGVNMDRESIELDVALESFVEAWFDFSGIEPEEKNKETN